MAAPLAGARRRVRVVVLDTIVAVKNLPRDQTSFSRTAPSRLKGNKAAVRFARYNVDEMVFIGLDGVTFGHGKAQYSLPEVRIRNGCARADTLGAWDGASIRLQAVQEYRVLSSGRRCMALLAIGRPIWRPVHLSR